MKWFNNNNSPRFSGSGILCRAHPGCFLLHFILIWGFTSGLVVKNSPAMQETWVQGLGQGHSLEREMVTHSSILAWRIP